MKKYWLEIRKYTPLLKELVLRDIKVRYRRSFLGVLWTVLTPLLTMLVMTFLFAQLFKNDIQNFAVYYFTGYILYGFLNESTTMSLRSVVDNQNLIRKVYIPKYLFPLSKVASSLLNLVFSFVAMILVMLFTGSRFYPTIFLSFIVIFFLSLFCLGLGMTLSTMFVFFRDIGHFYGVLMLLWMYLTPIFYPVSLLKDRAEFVLWCNPLYYYVCTFRNLVCDGILPPFPVWFGGILIAGITFIIGSYVFYKNENRFILYI